jgi:hypothetical protein
MPQTPYESAGAIAFDNGICIELLRSDSEFLGFGEITAGRTPLRSGRRPMFVEIRNPNGVSLLDYRILEREFHHSGALMRFGMAARAGGPMDWMVHTVRNRYNTTDWTSDPEPAKDTQLRLEMRPVTRKVGGEEAVGFNYRYYYRSGSIPIYKILDRGTWEAGGRAVGNEIWMRSCFSPPIAAIKSAEQFFSTEWYLPSIANPNIFQFFPLQTELQGFTFTASDAGVLVTWPTEVAHVRTLIEKPRGVDEIVHWHEHCGDLAHEFTTSAVEVLWFPGKRDFTGRANLYEAVKEMVAETLHAQIGMKRERNATYGMIEEWENADFKRYTELGLLKLLDAGVKTVGLANHFQNNMNTYGVSNMCCTVDLKVAESVGEENVRAFCQKAKAGGATVEMWGNTSLSTLSWILDQRNGREQRIRFLPREGSIMEALAKTQSAFVRNPSNAIEADHYTPVFAVMNLRDPIVRETWLKRWKDAHDRIGLGRIFLDSSFNLSSDKFHWVANPDLGRTHGATADQTHLLGHFRSAVEPPSAILSQYRAHLELIVEMQKLGYQYCAEDLGVFGIHRHGPGIATRLSSLPIWTECLVGFDVPELQKAGADLDDVFFRGLAYGLMWMLFWDIKSDRLTFHYGGVRGEDDLPSAKQLALVKLHNEVSPMMFHRTILPDEKGVLYEHEGQRVLWAFKDCTVELPAACEITDKTTGERTRSGAIKAGKQRVYVAE